MVTAYIGQVVEYRSERAKYVRRLSEAKHDGLFAAAEPVGPEPSADSLKALILEIDELVIKGYNLPPPDERDIINYFRGKERPLPFPFPEYAESLIRRRLDEQTRALDEDAEEQRETWEWLKKALDEDRLSSRKLFQ